LGESVPTDSLNDLNKYFDSIVFVSYMTVQPDKEHVNDYIKEIQQTVLKDDSEIWLIGRMVDEIKPSTLNNVTRVFGSIADLVEEL
jgi:signal recognition particle GTPase